MWELIRDINVIYGTNAEHEMFDLLIEQISLERKFQKNKNSMTTEQILDEHFNERKDLI